MKSATLKASPCTLCVKHDLSSLIAGDTLCQQLVVRTATFKAHLHVKLIDADVCYTIIIVVDCKETLYVQYVQASCVCIAHNCLWHVPM